MRLPRSQRRSVIVEEGKGRRILVVFAMEGGCVAQISSWISVEDVAGFAGRLGAELARPRKGRGRLVIKNT